MHNSHQRNSHSHTSRVHKHSRSFYPWTLWLGLLCTFLFLVTILNIKKPEVEVVEASNELVPPAKTISQPATMPSKEDLLVKKLAKKPYELRKLRHFRQTSDHREDWNQITIKPGHTLSKIFSEHNLPMEALQKILDSHDSGRFHLTKIKPGQTLKYYIDESGGLNGLALEVDDVSTISFLRDGETYAFSKEKKPIETVLAYKTAFIEDSLFTAADKAGLEHKLIMQLADMFCWDIDFALDIRNGDYFKLLYEEKHVNNQKVGIGDIVAAEFINQGKSYKAVRYINSNNDARYYTPDGYCMHKAFIRTPVKFTRISSRFSTGRRHPVLHKMRAHKGVDYAAPSGTPVRATGDGKISFLGTQGGYGKVIHIQHGHKYTTVYAHLSRFGKNLKKGSPVKQGQTIGYVGMTGLASGPHLHYEFRVLGIHRDPLTVDLPRANPIPKQIRPEFLQHAKKVLQLLNEHDIRLAKVQSFEKEIR